MSDLTQPLAAETQALREMYAALNRNDIPAVIELFDPQIEWTEPAERPGVRTCHGHAELQAHFSQARATWAEGGCEPAQFIVAGDKIIAFVDVLVRLKDEVEWREGQLADVYTFRNGKAFQMRAFNDRQEALDWAGVDATGAS